MRRTAIFSFPFGWTREEQMVNNCHAPCAWALGGVARLFRTARKTTSPFGISARRTILIRMSGHGGEVQLKMRAALLVASQGCPGSILHALQASNMEPDDPQKSFIEEAVNRVCRTLKADFISFVPPLLEHALRVLSIKPEKARAAGEPLTPFLFLLLGDSVCKGV